MGDPSLGSRCMKPSTLSILPANAGEGCIVRKSVIAGRCSRRGMWRLVNVTGSLPGGPAGVEREGPRMTRRTGRRTQECLLHDGWHTTSLQNGFPGTEKGQEMVARRTLVSSLLRVLTTEEVQELALPNSDSGLF